MADTLPEFVAEGEFEDHEWRTAASKRQGQRNRAEQLRYEKGPRKHPYSDKHAHYVEPGEHGPGKWFENKQRAEAWLAAHGGSAQQQAPAQRARTPASQPNPVQTEITREQGAQYAQDVDSGKKKPPTVT